MALVLAALVLACSATCSASVPRIVGGELAPRGAYPSIVALVDASAGDDVFAGQFCAGIIVHESYVLTAAHCVVRGGGGSNAATVLQPTDLYVYAGNTHLDSSKNGQVRALAQIMAHRDFHMNTLVNDVALLRTQQPFTLAPGQVEIAPVGMSPVEGDNVTVVGWGNTVYPGAVFSRDLMRVVVQVSSLSRCNIVYGGQVHADTQICATANGKDACQGDSGGPMYDAQGAAIGVVSYGIECGNPTYPGVYSRIVGFESWFISMLDTACMTGAISQDRNGVCCMTNTQVDGVCRSSSASHVSWTIACLLAAAAAIVTL